MSFEKFREDCEKLIGEKEKLETPPGEINADLAFPCFHLAKQEKRNPIKIAEELEQKLKKKIATGSLVKDVRAMGPYVNFYIDNERFSEGIIKDVLKQEEKFGKGEKKKEKIMVEFAHPNTHKAFHIGHTRNITLGESICRLLESNGITVVRTNYQGDIGMHVAKTLWGLMRLKKLKEKEPKDGKGQWLGIIYAKASKFAQDEEVKEKVNEINQKLYAGDAKLVKLWKRTRQWSLDYYNNVIYPDFGVKFDRLYFESEVEKKGTEIAKDILKKGIAKMSEGAIIMDFEKENMGIYILLKSDGTPLYATKDLYLAELQDKEYRADKILHVVAAEQDLYFRQLFKTMELYSPELAKKEEHMSYELVILPSGKMASREGKVILYDDTLAKMIDIIKDKVKKSGRKFSGKVLEVKSKQIALGAIKYAMLSHDSRKVIVFNEEEVLSFEGNTGPYIQYTHARANSILKKSKKDVAKKVKLTDEKEFDIAKKISMFSETIQRSSKDYKPHYLANYLFELATDFNEYYHQTRVMGSENETSKLALVKSVMIVLENGLKLLGIEAPDEM